MIPDLGSISGSISASGDSASAAGATDHRGRHAGHHDHDDHEHDDHDRRYHEHDDHNAGDHDDPTRGDHDHQIRGHRGRHSVSPNTPVYAGHDDHARWQTVRVRLAAALSTLALLLATAAPGGASGAGEPGGPDVPALAATSPPARIAPGPASPPVVAGPVGALTGASAETLRILAASGAAEPSPAPPVRGEVVCTVDDPRAIDLSGLVATDRGYVAIVDSQYDTSQVVIVYLDHACRVVRTLGYPTPPRDPEDLAVAPDGALWVADIGDNITASQRRQTIALWRIPPEGGPPVIHRLTYPDGPHDAEALLFAADGSPVIVTKELGRPAYLYQATRPLEPNTPDGVPLRRVGEFQPVVTSGPTDLFQLVESAVTGAATSPDRSRVALRTYAAAYEWDVPDGDVVKAITTTTPRVLPLPDEPQGEAIAYTVDGQYLLTISDVAGPTPILRYPRPTAPAPGASQATPLATVTASPPMTPAAWLGYGLGVIGVAFLVGFVVWWLARRLLR